MYPVDPVSARDDGPFSVSSHRLEDGIAVVPSGELDLMSAPIVEAELQRAEHSESLIVLDLQHVSFMDSTGVRMVLTVERRLRERGAHLRIAHVPPQVRRLFDLVGISEHLEILDEESMHAANGCA